MTSFEAGFAEEDELHAGPEQFKCMKPYLDIYSAVRVHE